MSLLELVLANLRQHRLSSLLTGLSVALGVMLIVASLVLQRDVADYLERPGRGYNLVVGPAKGDERSLVLNSVFNLGDSSGLLAWGTYDREVRQHPNTMHSVPFAVGDSFRGYRIVGTTDALFSSRVPQPPGEGVEKLSEGRPFAYSEAALMAVFATLPGQRGYEVPDSGFGAELREAVVGSAVARSQKMRLQDRFEPTHGIEGTVHESAETWEVVGILKPTGTPVDETIYINLDSFYRIADHREGSIVPGTTEPGISGALLWPSPRIGKALLLSNLKRSVNLQVADVQREVAAIRGLAGNVEKILLAFSILVVIVGAISLLVAISNTMSARRREIAVLRALGARRRTVMGVILSEATVIAAVGALVGAPLGHLLLIASGGFIERVSGFRPSAFEALGAELWVILGVTLLGVLAGLVPALTGYRTPVAKNLSPLS